MPSAIEDVAAVRRFNRFYTRHTGLLGRRFLDSEFSLAEVRVLYELAHGEAVTATAIADELGLDTGYLSRILRGFERRGVMTRRRAPGDARRALLSLTNEGRRVFGRLNGRQNAEVRSWLRH